MRIKGEISHPVYKITVFEMSGKLSIKIEDRLLEQTYKFRDGSGIDTLSDVREFINEDFLSEVSTAFSQMQHSKLSRLQKMSSDDGHFFDEII